MAKYKTKKQLVLVPAKNNPRVLEQNETQAGIDELNKIHRSPINFDSKIGFKELTPTYGRHISFIPISDLHYANARPEVLDVLDNYLKNTVTDIMHHGDMLQVAVEGHHIGEVMESKLNTAEEQLLFADRIEKYAEKIVVATGGNHDDPEFASRLKNSYLSALLPIYKQYGIKYYENACVVEYKVPVTQTEEASLWCVVMHCNGGTSTKKLMSAQKTYEQGMGVIAKFNQEHFGTDKSKYVVPDFILGGHFHANSSLDQSYERNRYDKNGKVVGTYIQTIRVRSNSTLQNNNSTSFTRGFSNPVVPNLTQFDVHFVKNPFFEKSNFSKNPKYIPIVTEFSIFNRDFKLTKMAEKYMEMRKDKDFKEQIKEEHKNNTIKELLESFEEKSMWGEKW